MLTRFLANLVRGHEDTRWVRAVRNRCWELLAGCENWNYDAATNGEARVLDVLARFEPRCIFDVGAHEGEWASLVRARCDAQVHCFEIHPGTLERLRRRHGADPRIQIADAGLSDRPGQVDLYSFAADSRLSSMVDYRDDLPSTQERGTVRTGDDYVAAHAIDTIDLLKLDVEGAEDKVLAGFRRTLARGRIGAIQFEYGSVNITTRFLLRDFYELFGGHGFTVGKIYPQRVEFRPWMPEHEDFRGPNYLAVHKSREELVAELARKGG